MTLDPSFRVAIFLVTAFIVVLSAGLRADDLDPVFYELGPGSVLIDDCLDCDRALIEMPLRGTLVLRRLPVRIIGELYEVSEIDLETTAADPPIAVRGTGSYHRASLDVERFSLEVTIGDSKPIALESGEVKPAGIWPAIDLTASEPTEGGARDPLHVFRIRIVAAPREDAVLYRLAPGERTGFTGSIFTDDCKICGRLTIPILVQGRFLLIPEAVGGPNPFDSYRIAALEVTNVEALPVVLIRGTGSYVHGGEVAVTQAMTLDVDIGVGDGVEMLTVTTVLEAELGPLPQDVRFPTIDIGLRGDDPTNPIRGFTLRLVAEPDEKPHEDAFFRRGDANDDAAVDIADAVYDLVWLFTGGREPPCLDAADVDGDGEINLTDAVALLDYLFRGGPAPPAPGPDACSFGTPILGCASAAGCGGI